MLIATVFCARNTRYILDTSRVNSYFVQVAHDTKIESTSIAISNMMHNHSAQLKYTRVCHPAYIQKIRDSDILKFPVEWRESIKDHLAGAFVGNSYAHDFVENYHSDTYYVLLKDYPDGVSLTTASCKLRIAIDVNDFPSTLNSDGGYKYCYRQEVSLPFQFDSLIRYRGFPIIARQTTVGALTWDWSSSHRKKYICMARRRTNEFASCCSCYDYLNVR